MGRSLGRTDRLWGCEVTGLADPSPASPRLLVWGSARDGRLTPIPLSYIWLPALTLGVSSGSFYLQRSSC